ncbi:MAG TPA: hypothetical protein VHE61_17340 [Opitutaceae bacterium]|nr:hypothetical protein [Opitutaceae bacterium]
MKLCRFQLDDNDVRVGGVRDDGSVLDLSAAGIRRLELVLEDTDPAARVRAAAATNPPRHRLADVRLCAPVEAQEAS